MYDALIVGGGVIGLSIAYELAGRGLRVGLVDRGEPGRGASWAGAGILPPHERTPSSTSDQQLAGLSSELYPEWSCRLREETGIDNGFRRSGGLRIARDLPSAQQLDVLAAGWKDQGVAVRRLSSDEVREEEPHLNVGGSGGEGDRFESAYLLSHEAQIRNPWHLKALLRACNQKGVDVHRGTAVDEFITRKGRVEAVITSAGRIEAKTFVLASGCWSGPLARRLGLNTTIRPVRGQMILLACLQAPLRRIVTEGIRYLVPRTDGRVLVGATQEDVGFDCRTTGGGLAELLQFALSLVPSLDDATIERTWAGLRPGSADGQCYLGWIPGVTNALIAAGHFRNGLQRAPATALVIGQLVCGEDPPIDLTGLSPQRDGDDGR